MSLLSNTDVLESAESAVMPSNKFLTDFVLNTPYLVALLNSSLELTHCSNAFVVEYPDAGPGAEKDTLEKFWSDFSGHPFSETEIRDALDKYGVYEAELSFTDTGKGRVRILLQKVHSQNSATPYMLSLLPQQREQMDTQQVLNDQIHHLDIISAVCREIRSIDTIETLVEYVAECLYERKFHYHHVGIFLKKTINRKESWVLVVNKGTTAEYFDKNFPNGYSQPLNIGVLGRVAEEGRTIFIRDVSKDSSYFKLPKLDCVSELAVPVKINDAIIGIINIESQIPMNLDETEMLMLESIAEILALGIQRIINTQELQAQNEEMQKFLFDLQASRDQLENQSHELVETLAEVDHAKAVIEMQNAVLEKEMLVGSDLQKSLLPKEFPRDCHLNFGSVYIPSTQLAGDIFDVFVLDENHIGIIIADVSGHGVSAAIIAAMFKAFLTNYRHKNLNPSEVLQAVNADVNASLTTGDFITAFYMVINTQTRQAVYSSAAHPAPIVLRKKNRKIERLDTDGFFLGIFPDGKYAQKSIRLKSGDLILLYTDGLIEAKNPEKEEYGNERLTNFFRNLDTADASSTLELLKKDLIRFCGVTEFDDDVTLLAVEIQ